MRNKSQLKLFELSKKESADKIDSKYTSKIKAPIYEIRGKRPHLLKLINTNKYYELKKDIEASSLPEDEKEFLRLAATRHLVFIFKDIAEYYAHASKEMQKLMEDSALIIIDFERAIELGYVKLCEDIAEQYIEDSNA